MYDFDCQTGENKLRRFFATHGEILDDLLALKQADYSACTDDLSPAPTVKKWKRILQKMQSEGAPLTLKQLAVTGKELLAIGIPAPEISKTLTKLLMHASVNPEDNQTSRLLFLARKL
jgi:poly(A) polymerase/tRNA nucleotidyltransferase (CCA-adding enzyme)